jgi:hypothetical protein
MSLPQSPARSFLSLLFHEDAEGVDVDLQIAECVSDAADDADRIVVDAVFGFLPIVAGERKRDVESDDAAFGVIGGCCCSPFGRNRADVGFFADRVDDRAFGGAIVFPRVLELDEQNIDIVFYNS